MAVFSYKAIDSKGQEVSATLDAPNRRTVFDRLQEQALCPVTIVAQEDKARPGLLRSARVSKNDIESFTRELASLLGAGVPLSRGLGILSREASRAGARQQWQAVSDLVAAGTSLGDAMAHFPRSFPPVTIAMVRAGETGGFLDVVLGQIADFRTREQDLLGKVRSALIYPVILAVLASGILVFLMTFFIPRFSQMFADFGGSLPVLTQAIVGLSNFILRYGLFVVLGLVALIVGAHRYAATPDGRLAIEKVLLRTPLLGTAIGRFALVRFARMLGTLVGAGVPLVTALRTAKEAIGNQVLANAVTGTIEKVQRGQGLARSLADCPQLFPASVIEMVSVAEESGKLDSELVRLAGAHEQQLDRHLKMMVALVEPALLFVMAVLVGTVVIGMLLPIFNLQELIR